jgi:large subunit ribosomal protein L10
MPMTKERKAESVSEITSLLEGAATVYLTNYSGLTVAQANELRVRFRNAGVQFRVFKNTLVRHAMQTIGGYDDLFDHLEGPTAVAFSEEPSAPARVIRDFLKDKNTEKPELKAAYIDGAFYGPGSLETLVALKSKDELVADIVGLILSPASNIVGAIQSPAQTLVGAIKTIAEKAEA